MSKGGRVLVHCSQGVSRSATIVIAYLMWKTGQTYDEVFAKVKGIRGVANPNIGFTCQLLQWQKRKSQQLTRMRMYRMVPHCQHAPTLLVSLWVMHCPMPMWRKCMASIDRTPRQRWAPSNSLHCTGDQAVHFHGSTSKHESRRQEKVWWLRFKPM